MSKGREMVPHEFGTQVRFDIVGMMILNSKNHNTLPVPRPMDSNEGKVDQNDNYVAYLKESSYQLIKERTKGKCSEEQHENLLDCLVGFKPKTEIKLDPADKGVTLHCPVIAWEIQSDTHDIPKGHKIYAILATLLDDPKKAVRGAKIDETGSSHVHNLGIYGRFYAKPEDEMKVEMSGINKNGFGKKRG
jgi:hypothetical protein